MKTYREPMVHEALRQIPYGLYVLGVRGDNHGDVNATAVSWVTQCSFDPPLLLVAVRKPSRTYDLLTTGKVFSLNLVDKKEKEILRALERPFMSAGNKLGKVDHVEEQTGAPILRLAFAYVECEVRACYEPGDHALIVGEVVNGAVRESGELATCADLKWHYGG